MSVGERLKELRDSKNMSLRELANVLEISNSVISAYETGKSSPTVNVIAKYIEHFGIDANWLVIGTKKTGDDLTENEVEILELFKWLQEREQMKWISRLEDRVDEIKRENITREGKLSM